MSYQRIDLKIENTQRKATSTSPLYVSLGALSPNDMTLKIIVYTDVTKENINYIRHSPTRTE